MRSQAFPFPSKELARKELERDYSIDKIPAEDLDGIVEVAWDRGIYAAKLSMDRFKSKDFSKIINNLGIKLIDKNLDHLVGNVRFFSEYYTKSNKIIMYTQSISKWAEANQLAYTVAYNLILCHEFFHYLEHTEIGYTSQLYKRPIIKMGNLKIGSTGVKAMSEIAAHSFVYELFAKEDLSREKFEL